MSLCLQLVGSSCRHRAHFSRFIKCSAKSFNPLVTAKQSYATQNPSNVPPSRPSLRLSETLDQRQRRGPSVQPDSVGPFQLGMAPSYSGAGTSVKWKDLSTKGKVLRSTANTSNLAVILVGAGLCCVLIYSLTSELFSPNSPTVLYGDACDRIKASPKIRKYLKGNLTFHTEPPSSLRPRHRNRQVASHIVVDQAGREHLFLNFYVSSTLSSEKDNLTYSEKIGAWWDSVSNMNSQEYMAWVQLQASKSWDKVKGVVRFVSGSPENGRALEDSALVVDTQPGAPEAEESSRSWLSGMFGSLKVASGGGSNIHVTHPELDTRTFQEGEVHVNFVRSSDGYFMYRYLVVDLPTSSARTNHVRVYVERAPNVSDREVMLR